jgi:branched-chain amino acid transport system permease protein
MSLFSRDIAAVLVIAMVAGVGGTFLSEGSQHFVAQIMILGMFASAFDLAYGRTGIFSIGHAAFFGGGAYAYALLSLKAGLGFFPSLAGAILIGGALATLFGLLAIRATGIYFALSTLAMGQLFSVLVEIKFRGLSGGADGIAGVPRPDFFGLDFGVTRNYLWLICIAFAIVLTLLALIRRSPYGQTLLAVRENPVRAEQLGYSVHFYRVTAFAISGAFSGLAGALFGSLTMFVGPDMLRWMNSGDVLIMTILGGPGSLLGPLLGVAIFETAREVISRYTQHWLGFVGALFIVVTLFAPTGLVGLWSTLRRAVSSRRAARPTSSDRQ